MFARLTALVGTGSSLPFDVTGESNLVWGSWTHARGKWRADGSEVSVFRVSSSNPSDPKLAAARNGVKRLRTVREIWRGGHRGWWMLAEARWMRVGALRGCVPWIHVPTTARHAPLYP